MAGNKKIPKEKVYSREQLKKRARLFRLMSSFSPVGSSASKNVVGKEVLLPTEAGQVRVLTYNMESEQKLPLFVNIHGGGFVIGSPEMDDPYLMNVAHQANVKIISIDYSLSPEVVFPTALNECYAVVKYAKQHADQLGIDPENIAVGGHSAGGNLTAAMCLKDALTSKPELNIKCIILDYPPLDLHRDAYLKPQPKGAIPPKMARMFDACYTVEKEDRLNPLVSPLYASLNDLKTFPPTLLLTAGQDSLLQEEEGFRDKLVEAGVELTYKCFQNSYHGFTHSDKEDAVAGWQMMIDHLKRYLV